MIGYVTTSLKYGATEQSITMIHAVKLIQQIQETVKVKDNTRIPFSFSIRSDEGYDTNPRNISVILSSIYTFLVKDLDLLIHLIMMDDISYVNKVKGITTLSNVVLQNQAYVRKKYLIIQKNYLRMQVLVKDQRCYKFYTECKKDTEDLESWKESISDCKIIVEKRFVKFISVKKMLKYFLLQKMMT